MRFKDLRHLHCRMLCVFSCVWVFGTPRAAACQASLSIDFSRQEYWSVVAFPSPGDLSEPGIKPLSPVSPALAGRFFTNRVIWILRPITKRELWRLCGVDTWSDISADRNADRTQIQMSAYSFSWFITKVKLQRRPKKGWSFSIVTMDPRISPIPLLHTIHRKTIIGPK